MSDTSKVQGASSSDIVSKFVFGGVAGMSATCVVQPLDLIKNRMQVLGADPANKGKNITTISVIKNVLKREGFLSFYNGLSAGLLRQVTYTTTRMGLFNSLNDYLTAQGKSGFFVQLGCGAISGGCAAVVGNPAEVSLIRMTADGRLPLDQRRNYSSVFNALARIVREEGVSRLWAGCGPTIGRSVLVNASQLCSYTQAKDKLHSTGYFTNKEGLPLRFCSAMVSGLITTTVSMPVDIAKTRLQNMKSAGVGKAEYSGTLDVLKKITKNEGFFNLWKGFFPYYFRLGPHTVLTFLILEKLGDLYRSR